MCDFFGGPSKQEELNADQTQNFADTLEGNYGTEFQEQQQALSTLKAQTQRIASGNTGYGFSPELNQDLKSQIVNQGAAQARNVTQAVQNSRAGQTFAGETDSSGLARASGTAAQLKEETLSNANTATSNQLAQEDIANINAGRENAVTAANQEQGIVKAYDPQAYARLAGGQLAQAGEDYTQINQEKIAKAQAIGKLGLSAVTTLATGGIGGLAGMARMGGGVTGFLKAGANALSGGANPFQAPAPSVPENDTWDLSMQPGVGF